MNYKIIKEYNKNLTMIMDLIGSTTTDNIQLDNLGKALFGDLFVGVFKSDDKIVLKNNQMCIINTDNKNGIHWVSLYKYKNKIYYYDSFFRSKEKLNESWKSKNWTNANKDVDQSMNEFNCGSRCMAWLISFQKYKTKIINVI